ncbi:hypothetical protein [Naumannella huperziae]
MLNRLAKPVRRDLAGHLGASPRVLAWGRVVDGRWCVALPDRLVWGGVPEGAGQWEELAYHLIEHGGWNAELSELAWTRTDGRRGSLRLVDPGRLPEAFVDRVNATIVARERVPIEGTDDGVVISGRRDLTDPDAPLTWRASPMRGTRLSDPRVAAEVDAAIARVRAEYDI